MSKKLSYSFDEENYNGSFATIEELVNELLYEFVDEIEEGQDYLVVSIGENVPYSDKGSDAYATIIEYFQEEAYDKSDYAESYLSYIKPEDEKIFKNKLDKIWNEFKKQINDEHPFFNVINCKNYRVYKDGRYEVFNT